MKSFIPLLLLLPTVAISTPMIPPPPPPCPTTWPDCQSCLSCTFDTIQSLTLATRLTYLQWMQSEYFGPDLKCPTQWRAIEGVIEFFQSKNLGAPGTWVSYTDAGIIEAIQRGGAIALGMSTDTGGNPGSELWANFMTKMNAGELNNRDDHDFAWSWAEQNSTDYGKSIADGKVKAKTVPAPTVQTLRWFQFTQIFRAMMRNRQTIIDIILGLSISGLPFGTGIGLIAVPFFDWFTDITQVIPTVCGAGSAWTLSALDNPIANPESVLKDTGLLAQILPQFIWCYIKNIF